MTLTQINTNGIQDANVNTADIADDAVTTAKIADNAVVASSINASSVTTAKIADDAVTSAKIAGDVAISTTGNIGCQALTTQGNITVNNNYPCINLTDTDNNSDYQIRNNNGQFAIQDLTNSAQRFSISSGGNVGIGTSSADTLLHLRGADTAIIRLENSDDSLVANQIIGGLEFEKTDPNGGGAGVVGGLRMYSQGVVGENTYLTLSTSDSSTNNVERMRITATGRVGINENGPTKTLVVSENDSECVAIIKSSDTGTAGLYLGGQTDEIKGGILFNNTTNELTLQGNNNAQRAVIDTSGNFKINSGNLVVGTAGKGIDFSAQTATSATNATTGAEVLDHYEEGSWTPVPSFGDNLSGATYQIANCQYTRIGRQVNIKGNINFSSRGSSTGGFKITGIPFSDAYAGSYSHSVGAVIVFFGPNSTGSMNCFTSGSNQVRFRMHNESNDNQEPQHGDFDNDTKIMFSVTYFTS